MAASLCARSHGLRSLARARAREEYEIGRAASYGFWRVPKDRDALSDAARSG
jgi:hypothetical protein